jgi:mannitol/fructose-specific phosphotransferase system IIA component
VPSGDVTATLRSLGDPPLQGQGAVAEHYVAAVVERAASLATALAASAGLLADDSD